ncbi:hypothetical protein LCGC14_1306910 [marine sediment metagenome]|uniref:Transcriptional coactivator p15 (PC4) C-terminal domain-containing protein n=1 Tax=marine sediment metagenome TaxID=412755 RepID=A0A0F9KNG0_9ZZZZ
MASTIEVPEGVDPEEFKKALTDFAKKQTQSARDFNIVIKDIERDTGALRLSHDSFKGREYCSLRVWYEDKDSGELKPGKGANFNYEEIDEIIEGLQALKEHMEEQQ